ACTQGTSRSTPESAAPASSSSSTRRAPYHGVCGNPGPAPRRYESVVVFAFENRTWDSVGLGFGPAMPYLHTLGQRCSYFADWTETDTSQNSLTQYVGQVTGAFQASTVNDCSPS